VTLFEWGAQVLAECEPVAAALDAAVDATPGAETHREALAMAVERLRDADSTPSARVLHTM
jgi:glutamate--cysteine ligase